MEDSCCFDDGVIRDPYRFKNWDNIILDFKKIPIRPVCDGKKNVNITVTENLYQYSIYTHPHVEHEFVIENEEDAHRIIKEFIINNEKSPELVFEVGYCKNPTTCNTIENYKYNCCKHRLRQFDYGPYGMCIKGYSKTRYKITIVL